VDEENVPDFEAESAVFSKRASIKLSSTKLNDTQVKKRGLQSAIM
jgi:hypothetical protein